MLPVLGPFAAYLGTAAKLFGLVSKFYECGERAVGRAHTSEEQRAAYVLRNAGMLLAAIRTLDNQVHSTIGALRTFNPNWTDEQRSQVTTRINDFAGQELVLPIVRQSLTELTGALNDWQTWQLTKIKTEPIRQLLTCGLSIQVAAGASDVTPFDDARTLRTLLEGVRTAARAARLMRSSNRLTPSSRPSIGAHWRTRTMPSASSGRTYCTSTRGCKMRCRIGPSLWMT